MGWKTTFTSFKAAYGTILKHTYLHQDYEDYEIHKSEQVKSENFSVMISFSLFFTEFFFFLKNAQQCDHKLKDFLNEEAGNHLCNGSIYILITQPGT